MNWKTSLRFKSIGVILVLTMMTIPLGDAAAAAAPGGESLGVSIIDPILINTGYIAGTMIGDIGKEVRVYRGIPYAAPPLGDNRWKPPQPVTSWTGIRECTKFSLMPPQRFPTPPLYGSIPESGMGENCLYVNVYTPAQQKTDRLPVMVWLHGGGLDGASGNDFSWNREYLAQHDVVLILVNARLGPLGYMAHPLLSAESKNGASGNYGQLDQIAALKWVQKNITAFGGDPDNVTIFGESGGGGKVRWLMASPLAKGLFQRAIVQSGAIVGDLEYTPLENAEQLGVNLATKLGVSTLADLRAKSWQDIITAALSPGGGNRSFMTVDGWSLLDTGGHVFQAGKQADVPFMIGMTEADIPPLFTGTQELVATMKFNSKTYVYLFTHVPTGWKSKGVKSGHGFDVAYLFYHLELLPIFSGRSVPSSAGLDPGFDEKDEYVAEAMMAMWTRFAKTGNPSIKDLIIWPSYESVSDQYLKIGYPLEVLSGFSKLKQ